MSLTLLALHVLAATVWLGGLVYQTHVMLPASRRVGGLPPVELLRAGRPVGWTALSLLVLTGFYNVTQLGPLDRVMASGAALLLAGKFLLVLVAVALTGQRDFAQIPRLGRALAAGQSAGPALKTIAWLDRVTLFLGVVIIYLGVAISRR
jgi:putative copper resistance protein D